MWGSRRIVTKIVFIFFNDTKILGDILLPILVPAESANECGDAREPNKYQCQVKM